MVWLNNTDKALTIQPLLYVHSDLSIVLGAFNDSNVEDLDEVLKSMRPLEGQLD